MLHVFPSDFVYLTHAKDHEAIKNDLLPKICSGLKDTETDYVGRWDSPVNTEFFRACLNGTNDVVKVAEKYGPLIDNEIIPAYTAMFEELKQLYPNYKTPMQSRLTEIWYNHYLKGDHQNVHNHGSGFGYSGFYILELKEENKTSFFSYTASSIGQVCGLDLKLAKEGDIVIFPSQLMHYVLPCEGPRTTVSFNISYT
jgi:hypothetical protein